MAMEKPKDWENIKAATERVPLPVGAYVCNILSAKTVDISAKDNPNVVAFSRLELAIDIVEGEYAGHFQADFDGQQSEDKRWKGVLRQYLPKDDGSEKDKWTARSLKALVEAIEESNVGFHFDWDEKSLKGKKVGIVFRNEQWVMGERSGWKAQPFRGIVVDKVRDGKFTLPKERPHKDARASIDIVPDTGDYAVIGDDEDLPF